MILDEERIKKYMGQIGQVTGEFHLIITDVIDRTKVEFKRISEEYEAKEIILPEIRYFEKALGMVCAQLAPVVVIPIPQTLEERKVTALERIANQLTTLAACVNITGTDMDNNPVGYIKGG